MAMKVIRIFLLGFVLVITNAAFAQGWEKTYELFSNGDAGQIILPTADGNYVGFSYEANSDTIRQHVFFKIDEHGTLIWQNIMEDSRAIYINDIIELAEGGFMVTGHWIRDGILQIYYAGFSDTGVLLWQEYDLTADDPYLALGLILIEEDDGNVVMTAIREVEDLVFTTMYRLSPQGVVLLENDLLDVAINKISKDENGQFRFIVENIGDDLIAEVGIIDNNFELVDVQPITFNEDYDVFVMEFTPDGGYLVKFFDREIYPPFSRIKKLGADAQEIWSQDIPGFTSGGSRIIVLDNGAFYLGGNHEIRFYQPDGVEVNRKIFEPLGTSPEGAENFWLGRYRRAHGEGLVAIGNLQHPGGPPLPIRTLIIRTDSIGNTYTNFIQGTIFFDESEDCMFTEGEVGIPDWVLELTRVGGDTLYIRADVDGTFNYAVDTGQYKLQYYPIDEYWTPCQLIHNIEFNEPDQIFVADFPMQALTDCAFLTVDVATTTLLAATQNTYYVNYCNLGTSLIDDASIVLDVDPFMIIDSFSIQPVSQDGDSYTFLLDELDYLDCGSFKAYVRLDTDSIVPGQTHCMQAQIFPDTLCDIDPSWSGASVKLTANCVEDSVVFIIENIGDGDMIAPRDYFVVEDHVILSTDDFELEAGEMEMIKFEADGSTYWMQALQEPGHPGQSNPNVWIEGCGADSEGDFTTGMATQFPEDDGNPSISIDCRENLASYDPNDKQVFPRGIAEEHYTEPGTTLEYQIRFQNTGTAPAFEVNIMDTLSSYLNPATVRPGVSSHPYEFKILENGALFFQFKDIMLPDSASNLEASQGFVKFKVDMREGVPLETVIYNRAGIYFDFNPPIITNETWNTVGYYFVILNDASEESSDEHTVNIYPNPFVGQTNIELGNFDGEALVTLFNTNGRLVHQQRAMENPFTLKVKHLPAGMYFYSIQSNGKNLSDGKLMIVK